MTHNVSTLKSERVFGLQPHDIVVAQSHKLIDHLVALSRDSSKYNDEFLEEEHQFVEGNLFLSQGNESALDMYQEGLLMDADKEKVHALILDNIQNEPSVENFKTLERIFSKVTPEMLEDLRQMKRKEANKKTDLESKDKEMLDEVMQKGMLSHLAVFFDNISAKSYKKVFSTHASIEEREESKIAFATIFKVMEYLQIVFSQTQSVSPQKLDSEDSSFRENLTRVVGHFSSLHMMREQKYQYEVVERDNRKFYFQNKTESRGETMNSLPDDVISIKIIESYYKDQINSAVSLLKSRKEITGGANPLVENLRSMFSARRLIPSNQSDFFLRNEVVNYLKTEFSEKAFEILHNQIWPFWVEHNMLPRGNRIETETATKLYEFLLCELINSSTGHCAFPTSKRDDTERRGAHCDCVLKLGDQYLGIDITTATGGATMQKKRDRLQKHGLFQPVKDFPLGHIANTVPVIHITINASNLKDIFTLYILLFDEFQRKGGDFESFRRQTVNHPKLQKMFSIKETALDIRDALQKTQNSQESVPDSRLPLVLEGLGKFIKEQEHGIGSPSLFRTSRS